MKKYNMIYDPNEKGFTKIRIFICKTNEDAFNINLQYQNSNIKNKNII